jgi:hypothetical protein
MRKQILVLSAALAGATACSSQLDVANPNNPDVQRAYATPALVEGVIAGLGLTVFNPERAGESINTQSQVLSGQSWGAVANFGITGRAALPHSGVLSNELGNENLTGNLANWNSFSIASRTASNSIAALDKSLKAGLTLGSPAQDQRARAFAYLMLAEALGNLSVGYDSAAITSPTLASSDVPPLVGAAAVNKAALAYLDSAINIASSTAAQTGGNGFPLPPTWINGLALSRLDFIKIAHSWKARLRAGAARTPAERAAVDWTAVIADATAGITEDFVVQIGNGSGWSSSFDVGTGYSNGYSMMPMAYYGMADTSGAYSAYLAIPRDQRTKFLVQTPDKRWPRGSTRAQQQTINTFTQLPTADGQVIRNRPTGEDVPVVGYGDTEYEYRRYGAVRAAGSIGGYVDFSKTENDMLAAEGYIRANNVAAAAALINISRVRNGLSSVLGVTSLTAPISTATSCVPQVPQAPGFTSASCGTLFEALKYEKRMDDTQTGYMLWMTDNRGWGDLIDNTTYEWSVPYQEMQARQLPYKNSTHASGKSNYGFN